MPSTPNSAKPPVPLHHPADGPPPRSGEELPHPTRKTPRQATSLVAYTPSPEPDDDDPLLNFAPYVHAAPRRNSITPDKQRKFIATLAATGIVSQAARSIGKSMEALYKLRHRPGAEGFAAAWDGAVERGLTRLEDCALELAIAGEELPIVSAGQLLGTYRKHNFGHIRFVLAARRSKAWGQEGAHFANLKPGHPVYERLKAEWARERAIESAARSEEVILSINAKLEAMRQRRLAAQAVEDAAEADEEPEDEDSRTETTANLPQVRSP